MSLFIILLPLLLVQTFMYAWSQEAVFEELSSAAAANVVYLRDAFVSDLQGIDMQFAHLVTNFTISSFFVKHELLTSAEYYMQAKEIRDLLALLSNMEPLLSEIRLHYITNGIAISSSRGISTMSDAQAEALVDTFRGQNSILTQVGAQWSIGHMDPATAYQRNRQPVYYVQGILSNAQIERHLASFSTYSNKNALLINHNTGGILASSNALLVDALGKLDDVVFPRDTQEVYRLSIDLGGEERYIAGCYSPLINCSFVQVIPMASLRSVADRLLGFLVILGVLAVVVLLGFAYVVSSQVRRPTRDLVHAFHVAGQGDFSAKVHGNYAWEYNELAHGFNTMTEQIESLIENSYEQTIRLQSAELKQLQAQINPHFLYNSFFFLRNAIDAHEMEQASRFAGYLGKYFSYITKQQHDFLLLSTENEHALAYLNIQIMRFDGLFSADIDELPDDVASIRVPRLILQPIFENALSHAYGEGAETERITMRIAIGERGLVSMRIEDNGGNLTDEGLEALRQGLADNTPLNTTSGLSNIHMRLRRFMGLPCGLVLSRSALGGLCVEVILRRGGGARDVSHPDRR